MRQSNTSVVPRKNYVLIKGEVQMPILGLSSDSAAKNYEFKFFVEGIGDEIEDLMLGDKVRIDLALYGQQMGANNVAMEENKNTRKKLDHHYNKAMVGKPGETSKFNNVNKKVKVIEYFLIQANWISAVDSSPTVDLPDLLPAL